MSPTFLILPMTDGKINMKFILKAHTYVPSCAYFHNLAEVVSYTLHNCHIPIEVNGIRLRSDEFMRRNEVVQGILKQDGSVTSEGKTFDFIFKKMKMVYSGCTLIKKPLADL